MIEISLWGNATDLSLLANLRFEDLEKLQGKKAIETQQKNIVVNDIEEAWKYFSTLQGAQIDIVLDNAGILFHKSTLMLGFELFVDVFLAAYFLEIGAAKTIICHPKDFGWFVSDVIPADFDSLFELLEDESIADTPQQHEDLRVLRGSVASILQIGEDPDPIRSILDNCTSVLEDAERLLLNFIKHYKRAIW